MACLLETFHQAWVAEVDQQSDDITRIHVLGATEGERVGEILARDKYRGIAVRVGAGGAQCGDLLRSQS